jgi:hypothetical protein
MIDFSEVSNDTLLQELRVRVQSGRVRIRIESLMPGRGALISVMSDTPAFGHFSFGCANGSLTGW